MKKSRMQILAIVLMGWSAVSFAGNQSGQDDDLDIEIGQIDLVMGNICNQSGHINVCDVDIENANVTLTDKQIVEFGDQLKGDDGVDGTDGINGADGKDGTDGINGADGADGQDGINGKDGADGKDGVNGQDGQDGITTVVNEYDRDQVDADFVSESELVSVTNEVTTNKQVNVNQQIEIDRTKESISDLNTRVDETYDAMREGDDQLQTQINDTNDRVTDVQQTLYEEGLIRAESDRIVADNAQKKLDQAVADQKVTDEVQDVKINDNSQNISDNRDNIINNKVTIAKNKAEQDAYNKNMDKIYKAQDSKINDNTAAIGALNKRVDQVEVEIAGIHNDNKRQDGMIAGVLAASTMEMPMNWNGDWAVQVGVGGYNNQEALALGLVTAGEGYAFRATVTGTNADEFSELAYGASVTISTSFFK